MILAALFLSHLMNSPASADSNYADVSAYFTKASNQAIEATPFGQARDTHQSFRLYTDAKDEPAPTWIALDTDAPTSQKLWNFNLDTFFYRTHENDALDAIRDFYASQKYDSKTAVLSRPYAYLKSWGQLFHPPVRELNTPDYRIFRPFSARGANKNESFHSADFQSHLDALTGHDLTIGNRTKLFQNGDSYREKIMQVKTAKKSIFVSVLALTCDATSNVLLNEMKAAHLRGVDVRVLVDHLYGLIGKSCIKKVQASGINVVVVKNPKFSLSLKATTNHTSLWVFDGTRILIGAQNLADANNSSDGYNFKDRDTDLEVVGPLATDALQEYIEVWNENQKTPDATLNPYLAQVAQNIAQQKEQGLRGSNHYGAWANKWPKGACRLAFQRPGRVRTGLSSLLLASIAQTQSLLEITTTQVQKNLSSLLSTNSSKATPLIAEIAKALQDKSKFRTRIDLIGNGIDGADGELTLALEDLAAHQYVKGNLMIGDLLESFNDRHSAKTADQNHTALKSLSSPTFKTYEYFNFYHGKQWYFDRTALVVGSMNFDAESFESHYEGAAMCFSPELNHEFERSLLLDLVNSVPVED